MATSNQSMQANLSGDRARRRRPFLIALLGLALIVWGPKAAIVLVDGWVKSKQVIEHQREIESTRQRVALLKQDVIEEDTSLGKDVQARRRFGVGPADEVGIMVEAERALDARPGPVSIADRINGWLHDVGGQFTDRVRDAVVVVRYWVGADEVERDMQTAEAVTDEDAPAHQTGPEEEAFGAGEDSR